VPSPSGSEAHPRGRASDIETGQFPADSELEVKVNPMGIVETAQGL